MSVDDFAERYNKYLVDIFSGEVLDRAKARAKMFEIDPNKLSEQVAEQPGAFDYVALLYAEATKKRNAAKLEEKVTKARRRLELKESPPITKPTVDDLTALVESDQQVVIAAAEHIHAQSILDCIEADKESLKQKAQMLYLLAQDVKRELMLKSGI